MTALWTRQGSEPLAIDQLPFRLQRVTGDLTGHTVTEIWTWPAKDQAQALVECGYVQAPARPEPQAGCVVTWTGTQWIQIAPAPLNLDGGIDLANEGTLA